MNHFYFEKGLRQFNRERNGLNNYILKYETQISIGNAMTTSRQFNLLALRNAPVCYGKCCWP